MPTDIEKHIDRVKDKWVLEPEMLDAVFSAKARPNTRTVRRWRDERKIPFYAMRGKNYYVIDEVREALKKKKVKTV